MENVYAEVVDALPDGRLHRVSQKPAPIKGQLRHHILWLTPAVSSVA